MSISNGSRDQSGFSLLELMIVLTITLIVTGSVFALMRNSLTISLTTYEMTDAQEGLRTAQEYINRDLIAAGDGLRGLNNICVRSNFVDNFLTKNAFVNPCGAGMVILPLVQSDNDVPAGTPVALSNPAVNVRLNPGSPEGSPDRITILQKDSDFTEVNLGDSAISADGAIITVPAADVGRLNVGEIYFITSSVGSTFGVVTGRNLGAQTLSFDSGDVYGLNQAIAGGPISMVSAGGTLPTSIMRMRIVHYLIDENGLLIRRVFGVGGGRGYTESVIAERVTNLQFRYILNLPGAGGLYEQPVAQLSTAQQQTALRQVETKVTTETAHAISSGARQPVTMTATTSVRNLQFRQALRP